MEPIDAGLMRKRLAAAAASERASLEALTERDLEDDILSFHGPLLTMRNATPHAGWVHSPEVDLLSFEGTDMPANELVKLARARFAARMERHRIRKRRYMRRRGQLQQSWPSKHLFGGITGTRPGMIIMDDPHAEMPTDAQRETLERWHEDRAPR